MYCICCEKNNVTPLDKLISEEELVYKLRNPQFGNFNTMIDGGIIYIIEAGYGSKHDGTQLLIAICDDCIVDKLKCGTLIYYGDYINHSESVNKEREKSKKIYRRRKNLDGLV